MVVVHQLLVAADRLAAALVDQAAAAMVVVHQLLTAAARLVAALVDQAPAVTAVAHRQRATVAAHRAAARLVAVPVD
jgi:hypothetical protein